MRTIATAMLMSAIIGLGIYGCGYTPTNTTTSGNNPNPTLNPTPAINTILPSGSGGGFAITITVTGTNFVAGSMVSFGGATLATTFINSTQLTAAIPAAALVSAGIVAVTVTNPPPGGGTSSAVNYTITSLTSPVIDLFSPSGVVAGGPAFALTVTGYNFVANSVVQWNGSDRPTAFVNSTQLTAQIPASDIVATGTAGITVFNPMPGSGTSYTYAFTIAKGGVGPISMAVDPTGKFAYVANAGSNNVSMYSVNAATGALTSIGTIAVGSFPQSVTIDPSGKFVYVANAGDFLDAGSVSMFTINASTGALTSVGTPVAADIGPNSVAVDPSGRFAYVTNGGNVNYGFGNFDGDVSMYTMDASTGALTSTGTIVAGYIPDFVAVHPSGKFAYVVNNGGDSCGNVSVYTINGTTGALTFTETTGAGCGSSWVAIDPSGKFAYVANANGLNGGSISVYNIDATTGALTSTGTIAAASEFWPASIAIDPSGKFAYVTNYGFSAGNVSTYAIDATTGILTSTGTTAPGMYPSYPTSITIDPSGKFAYVMNYSSNSVSMYSIDAATGVLTFMGTVGT
jgi:6-phosphogluconolactonase (cycloisomerase 2 family)